MPHALSPAWISLTLTSPILTRLLLTTESALRTQLHGLSSSSFFPVPMLSLRLLQTSRRIPWTLVKLQCSSKSQPNMAKPVELSIRSKLTQNLAPVHLEVHNESSMHAVPKGSETHFKVVVVSETFAGKSLIQRHRLVNEVLKAELDGPVHALSIQAKTPQQWEENPSISPSPACMGGSKHDPAMSKKLNSQV
ncbi:hypothetical protein FKM82_016180 [Ascaphus truei]